MPEPQGGLRDRMVFESLARFLHGCLDQLGWFDADRAHAPINWRTSIVPEAEVMPINTLALSSEDVSGDSMEIGSGLSEDRFIVIIDLYAESDALGRHLGGDIRDILRGKMSVNDTAGFVVYDLREDPPVPFSWAEIEGVTLDRSHGFDAPFRRHWFSVLAELVEARP